MPATVSPGIARQQPVSHSRHLFLLLDSDLNSCSVTVQNVIIYLFLQLQLSDFSSAGSLRAVFDKRMT